MSIIIFPCRDIYLYRKERTIVTHIGKVWNQTEKQIDMDYGGTGYPRPSKAGPGEETQFIHGGV